MASLLSTDAEASSTPCICSSKFVRKAQNCLDIAWDSLHYLDDALAYYKLLNLSWKIKHWKGTWIYLSAASSKQKLNQVHPRSQKLDEATDSSSQVMSSHFKMSSRHFQKPSSTFLKNFYKVQSSSIMHHQAPWSNVKSSQSIDEFSWWMLCAYIYAV